MRQVSVGPESLQVGDYVVRKYEPSDAPASPKKMQQVVPEPLDTNHSVKARVELVQIAQKDPTSDAEERDEDRPTASELARKRAERFGIPVITEPKSSEHEEPVDTEPAAESDQMEVEKTEPSNDKYRDLLTAGIPENSIIEIDDIVIDNANLKRIERVIESFGEDKVKEIVTAVVTKIGADFEQDRSKIRAPPRLATSRLSFALKQALPKPEREENKKKEMPKKTEIKKNDTGKKGKWTDEEWAEWNKDSNNNKWKKDDWKKDDWKKDNKDWKKDDWKKDNKDWKRDDWKDKKGGYGDKYEQKKPVRDEFESDVEEFIYRNKLDRRSAEAMRTESRGMVGFVMDEGFNLDRSNNPSKEVIMRMHAYRMKKLGRSSRRTSRSRSRSYRDRSLSRDKRVSQKRSLSRGRSRSRSDSRDRYDRGSRSRSM